MGLSERPWNYWLAVASGGRAPRLEIGLKFKGLHSIHQQRDAALRTGHLDVSNDEFAPATLEIDGHPASAELRLTDGARDALAGEKWPLQVHVTKGDSVFGIRALTLKEPDRSAHIDALFLEHLTQRGVLATRLLFVETLLNGRRLGLMALAELPSTELLERQQRRDGIVVEIEMDAVLTVGAVEPERVGRSSRLSSELGFAQLQVNKMHDRSAAADVVFDAETMGSFLAVAEHWGRSATLNWDSLRFYLNPLTSRLEPVGIPTERAVDSAGQASAITTTGTPLPVTPRVEPEVTPFVTEMLANPGIRAAFGRARETIAAAFADGSAWKQAAKRERALRRLLQRDDASIRALDFSSLEASLEASLDASPEASPGASLGDEPRSAIRADFPTEHLRAEQDETTPLPHRTLQENLERHPFLVWDAAAAELRVRSGNWLVRGSMILPDGVALAIPPSTVLRFEPQAGLIARGPLRFEGTKDAPIVLEGPPGTTRSQLWSGVYVVESDRPSYWKHVIVRNTGGFERGGWSLPGGLVFRKTHAELEHCALRTSLADDALNIIRSTFRLSDLEVTDVASDAVDFDYSQGSVERGSISRAAGDGLDLGGSQVEVSGTRFFEILDKAISVGELSQLAAHEIDVERVSIGIASKNGSETRIADSELREISRVGLVAYSNRSEYGPGTIRAERIRFARTARHALAEAGSRIVVDGIAMPVRDISVASVAALAAAE